MNAELIKQNMPQNERLAYLNNTTIEQMRSLVNSAAVQRLNAVVTAASALIEPKK